MLIRELGFEATAMRRMTGKSGGGALKPRPRLMAHGGVAACLFVLGPPAGQTLAQFAPAFPAPSPFCIDYGVINKTHYDVSIRFDNEDGESYDLGPGQSVTYHKVKYCSSPAYVVASYSGPDRSGMIGRNIALDLKTPNFEVVEAGRYVFLKPVGQPVPPEFR